MDEIKRISNDEFNNTASTLKFNVIPLTKDYFLTVIL